MANQAHRDNTSARRESVRKIMLVTAGTICVALATLGIFIPLLPTTPFLLLAVTCYTRSSDRLNKWLIGHRWFGPYIRNYREHRAVTLGTKIVSITFLWATMAYAILAVVDHWALHVLLIAVAIGVTIHLTRFTTATPEMLQSWRAEETGIPPTGEPSQA